MPNYNLVVNSTFQPMSLERYLKPFEDYGKAYREQEDALADLQAKASVWDKMANEQSDPIAHRQYKQYADALRAQGDSIATQGLKMGSRKAMQDLKARFETDIRPIEVAYKSREERQKMQDQAYINSGGKVRFNQRADSQSLDAYLNGNKPEMTMVNLDDVYKEAAAGAQAISKRYFTKPQIESLNKQYLLYTQEMGMSSARALEELEKKDSEFYKFAQSIRDKYKFRSFNADDRIDINASIRSGILTGLVNEINYKPLQDGEYVNAAERFNQTLAMRQLALKEAEEGATYDKDTKTYDIDYTKSNEYKKLTTVNNTIELPDGSIATPVKGSSGQWKVTHPDGTSELKDKKDIITKATTHPKPADFKPIDFEYKVFSDDIVLSTGNRGLFHNNYFSTSDAELISLDKLSDNAKDRLMQKLADYGLTLNDIDVYEDSDSFSRNSYRVVYKGDDSNGITPESTESTEPTQQEESKPQQKTYDGSFVNKN